MRAQAVHFFSDRNKIAGTIFSPTSAEGRAQDKPMLLICSGYTGICSLHPARFARYFTSFGYSCLGFDYRGFEKSDGPPFRVKLEEQAEDIRSALTYATTLNTPSAFRLIVVGWAMGAGLILRASFGNPDVHGLVALNGFYNGRRYLDSHLGADGLVEYQRKAEEWDQRAVKTGEEVFVYPFEMYPMDPVSTKHVDDELRKHPGYEAESYSTVFASSLLAWNPEVYANDLEVPLLLAHGRDNKLHLPKEAKSLHRSYNGPSEILWLEDAGHTEWMFDDHPTFQSLCEGMRTWIERNHE